MNQSLIEARDVSISYHTDHGRVDVVKHVSLKLGKGEAIGIVGESGSGKSTLVRALGGLLPPKVSEIRTGSLHVGDQDVTKLSESGWAKLRGQRVGMVFQDPLSFLNPVRRIRVQIAEAIRAHDPETEIRPRINELLGLMDLPERTADAYAHELSGGMRQRVLIAIALAKRPGLIIADEPTTALDVTVQAKVLESLDQSVTELGTSLIMISHDLAVVAELCDRVYVMLNGRIVESGPTREVFVNPREPYTEALLKSVRSLTVPGEELISYTAAITAAMAEEEQK